MFIMSANRPPLGVDVEIELDIPAFDLVPRPVKVCFVGQVNRIDSHYNLRGFAVAGRLVDETLGNAHCRLMLVIN